MSLVREFVGRMAWWSDSLQDLSECDERVENVGDGRAASGECGRTGSSIWRLVERRESRISDITESRGPSSGKEDDVCFDGLAQRGEE